MRCALCSCSFTPSEDFAAAVPRPWSSEKPKKPGWYWVKYGPRFMESVKVWQGMSGRLYIDSTRAASGANCLDDDTVYQSCLWQPIAPPKE